MIVGFVLEMRVLGLIVEIVVDSLEIEAVGYKDVDDLLLLPLLDLLYLRIGDDPLVVYAEVLLI